MIARLAPLFLCAAGCGSSAEVQLAIRMPDDRRLLAALTQVNMSALRNDNVLAQASFAASASQVTLTGVSHGTGTVVALDGVDSSAQVVARGRTCAFDFQGPTAPVPLYFAPTNFFSPTASRPVVERQYPIAAALSDGSVLIAGGSSASSELFTPGVGTFAAHTAMLNGSRSRAQSVSLSSIGVLVVGGLDATATAIAKAELYSESQKLWSEISDPRLDARVRHRVVMLSDGRALVLGGRPSETGAALDTTLLVHVRSQSAYQVSQGPKLAEARSDHAAVLAIDTPIVFGGYGATDAPLASIELVDAAAGRAGVVIAQLATARAEATASVLPQGTILVTGGRGASGLLKSAELFNPITRTTTQYEMAFARRGHTATVLGNGRVLIAGGLDENDQPITSVELFAADIGFLSDRSLGTARGNHSAVPLCDGTVLMVGGGSGAEIYSGSAD